jgi:AcrR family transcriptional regulator
MRSSAEQSRSLIQQSALSTFCERGYRTSTLEAIGAQVGVTRGTVLHHFHSKAELLTATIGPSQRALAALLDTACAQDPPTRSQRRRLLTDLLHLALAHRSALLLLATDVGARAQLGLGRPPAAPSERLITLLIGSNSGPAASIRVAATLGALILPAISIDRDSWASTTAADLVDSALAVLQRPMPPPSYPPAEFVPSAAAPLAVLAQPVSR